ncbi:MAG: O-methyltransferase [Patescibacteria group bacterium]
MKIDSKFLATVERLEKLDKEFLVEDVSDENNGKDGHWSHNNKIKLWSVGRATGELLRETVLIKKPQVVLELGTSAGYSSIWIASALPEGGKLFTVEISPQKIEMAQQSFAEAGLTESIVQIKGNILDVLESWDKMVDMVFIDADKHEYLEYLRKIEPHLNHGAVIIADNMTNFAEYVNDYREYLSNNKDYSNEFLEIEDGLLISTYK